MAAARHVLAPPVLPPDTVVRPVAVVGAVAMDYQCVIVYTIITILPDRSSWEPWVEPVRAPGSGGFARGCFAWLKRWIKR